MGDIVRPGMVVGAGPLIRAMAERIGLVPTIDGLVGWDPARCRLSPGERILALMINLRTDRAPLYQVWDAFALTDVPLLLGAGITADDLHKGGARCALVPLSASWTPF